MKILTPLLCAALCGCSSLHITIPPGSLTSWHHIDNYGFVQSRVTVTGVTKEADGSFTIGEYDGQISYMGFGPHDIIEGLHVDAAGVPLAGPVAGSVLKDQPAALNTRLTAFSTGNLMAPRISSSATTGANLGAAFVYPIEASNSPTAYSVTGNLPPGLVLEPHTGWIVGKAQVAGVFPVVAMASNSAGSSSMALTITIRP